MEIDEKRQKEIALITCMVDVYCKKKHKRKQRCPQCQELLDYAVKRIELCPFMETKTFCSSCKVHCYQKEKREQVREVMRFSGPWMLFYHPITAISHVINTRREKRK